MPANIAFWVHGLALPVAALLLVYAALHDVAARTIPDTIPAALAVLGLVLRVVEGSLLPAMAAAALLGICVGFCWSRGWLGGGDVKLLAALAMVLPPARVLPAITAIGWFGALLAVPFWVLRRRLGAPSSCRPAGLLARIWRAERFRLRRGGPLPYGLAIAAGGLLELFGR
ncbi:MAG TPA: prepilin peptidase [Acetobacteraceae bacterium]|nr:prepilin peptidase [Acetobacteraceae bacterium]